jgi:hypothetical protein
VSKEGKPRLNQVSVFALSNPVLLRSVWARDTMNYTGVLKILMQTMVFPTPIRLNRLDLGVQQTLNMGLKSVKHLLNIGFMFEEIDPAKTRVVIHKTNVVLVPS